VRCDIVALLSISLAVVAYRTVVCSLELNLEIV
jgi:hypothetical protein